MDPPEDPLAFAERVYRTVWDGGPYTSFDMIKYLVGKSLLKETGQNLPSHTKTEAFVEEPAIIRRLKAPGFGEDSMESDLRPLFDYKTGLCTSFAIKIARQLEGAARDTYAFEFYDLGSHRVARCQNTNIVIDSSAGNAVSLGSHGKKSSGTKCWQFMNSNFKYTNGKKKYIARRAIESKDALVRCLVQLAEANNFLCFFRRHNGHGTNAIATFSGMIKWQLGSRMVKLVSDEDGMRKTTTIEFGLKEGSIESNALCLSALEGFVTAELEGIARQEQYMCVREWHEELWIKAGQKWGWPMITKCDSVRL